MAVVTVAGHRSHPDRRAICRAMPYTQADFFGKPYMGPPSVPHVNPDFFKVCRPELPACWPATSVPASRLAAALSCLCLMPSRLQVYFAGAHLAVALASMPGRFFGLEARPRRFK